LPPPALLKGAMNPESARYNPPVGWRIDPSTDMLVRSFAEDQGITIAKAADKLIFEGYSQLHPADEEAAVPVDWDELILIWNTATCKSLGCRAIVRLGEGRKRKLRAMYRRNPTWLAELTLEARKVGRWFREECSVGFDWFLRASNLEKFMEGTYRDKEKPYTPNPRPHGFAPWPRTWKHYRDYRELALGEGCPPSQLEGCEIWGRQP